MICKISYILCVHIGRRSLRRSVHCSRGLVSVLCHRLYKNQNASLALHPLFSIPSQLGKMCRGAMVEPRDSAGQNSVVSLHYHRRCRCICCLIAVEQQPYYVRRVVCFFQIRKNGFGDKCFHVLVPASTDVCWMSRDSRTYGFVLNGLRKYHRGSEDMISRRLQMYQSSKGAYSSAALEQR